MRLSISAEELRQKIGATGFSGVISLAPLGAGASLDLALGFADRANRRPNTIDTRFAMASGCKTFTAVAVWQLIQEGKLGLDTLLADCVRSRRFHFGADVTIGQLLSHTSGVPDYFSEEIHTDYAALWRDRPCYRMTSIQDFLPLFETGAMKTLPDDGFLYSNSAFILLGLVVEELTGQAFRDVIAARIFEPCGMARSGYFAMDALPDNTALGYLAPADDDYHSNIYAVPLVGGPDGGAFTTAGDLRRFWAALLGARLLSRETLDRMLSPAVRVTEREGAWHYGYGIWRREQQRGGWFASIEGGDPGVALESQVRLGDGLVTTMLSNVPDGAEDVFWLLDDMVNAG